MCLFDFVFLFDWGDARAGNVGSKTRRRPNTTKTRDKRISENRLFGRATFKKIDFSEDRSFQESEFSKERLFIEY